MNNQGSEWVKAQPYGKDISEIGVKVADILGIAYRGIYHIDRAVARCNWGNQHWIEINVNDQLGTWDGSTLTELVILCHDQCVRMEIETGGPRRIKLVFHERGRVHEATWSRHPTIEDAIARVRRMEADE